MLTSSGTVDTNLILNTSNINYKNLKGNKYAKTEWSKNKLWTDVEDPRFIEWMKPPMSSNFYKIYGIYYGDLIKGTYRLSIKNDVRLLDNTRIEKEVFITNLTWLGGNNPWMYYSFFMVAIFLLFVGGSLMYVEKLEKAEYD